MKFGGGKKRPTDGGGEPPAKKPALEKKKNSNYHAYLKRDNTPPNHGKKQLPVGQELCLDGYRFVNLGRFCEVCVFEVITGVLDSLTREECKDLIQEYGG